MSSKIKELFTKICVRANVYFAKTGIKNDIRYITIGFISMLTLLISSIAVVGIADGDYNDESSIVDDSLVAVCETTTSTTITDITTKPTTTTTTMVSTTTTSTTSSTTTTETTTTNTTTTTCETTTCETTTTVEFMVYKPSTHYIHRSTCRWFNDECFEITCEEDIDEPARICSECCPDIALNNVYEEPVVEEPIEEPVEVVEESPYVQCGGAAGYGLTESEIWQLRKIVSYEYGADWVSVYDKACIVCGVMNMVRDPRYPNTITEVLSRQGIFPGFNQWGNYYISDSICQAVDYYFDHQNEFGDWNSWWGDGQRNHFYRT